MNKELNYHNILARACGQPLALEPGYARTFFSVLAERSGVRSLVDFNGEVLDSQQIKQQVSSYNSSEPRFRPYQIVNGVAIVPISGTLTHKFGYVKPISGMTGYDGILTRLQAAMSDPEVKGVLLDTDSPGGEVSGCFDLADMIHQMNTIKPIGSLCYDQTTSAAQMLASACGYRYITQSGIAGSIGVLMAHASYEKKLEKDGVEITLIYSGKEKVNGNPYQNLPEAVHKKMQVSANKTRDIFAGKVADYLGLEKQVVIDTEAAVYSGQDAVDIGFADELINGNEALAAFCDRIKQSSKTTVLMETTNMAKDKDQASGKNANTELSTESTPAKAATPAAMTAKEMQTRMGSILKSDSAKSVPTLANHLAFETELSAEDSELALKAAAVDMAAIKPAQKEEASDMESSFKKQMDNNGQLNVGEDSEESGEDSDPELTALAAACDVIV